MELNVKIEDNNFIIEDKKYSIIETFVDFIHSDVILICNKIIQFLNDFRISKDIKKYYTFINDNKIPIYYYPILKISKNMENNFLNYNNLSTFDKNLVDSWFNFVISNLNSFMEYKYYNYQSAFDICFNYSEPVFKNISLEKRYALCLYSNLFPNETYKIDITVIPNHSKELFTLCKTNDIDKNYDIIKNYSEIDLKKHICFNDMDSMCMYAFDKMIEERVIIKNCKNCGRYFIADNKREYCNRLFKDNLTCAEYAYKNSFKQKKETDIFLQEYMKAYKRVQNFCYKNKDIITDNMKKEMFQKIRTLYDSSKANNISESDYISKIQEYNYDFLINYYLKNINKSNIEHIKKEFKNIKNNSSKK